MKAIAGLLGATLLFAGPTVEASPWVPEFTWTGCYLGLDIGTAWTHQDVSTSGSVIGNQAPVSGTLDGTSGIVGVYAGCNWQFAPTWVLGLEGDYSWTELKDFT